MTWTSHDLQPFKCIDLPLLVDHIVILFSSLWIQTIFWMYLNSTCLCYPRWPKMCQYVCTTSWRAWRTNAAEPRTRTSCSGRGSSRWRSQNKHCTTSWRGPKRWAKGLWAHGFVMWSASHPYSVRDRWTQSPSWYDSHKLQKMWEKSLLCVCRIEFTSRGSLQGSPLVKKNTKICSDKVSDLPWRWFRHSYLWSSSKVYFRLLEGESFINTLIKRFLGCERASHLMQPYDHFVPLALSWNWKWMLSRGIHTCVLNIFFSFIIIPSIWKRDSEWKVNLSKLWWFATHQTNAPIASDDEALLLFAELAKN